MNSKIIKTRESVFAKFGNALFKQKGVNNNKIQKKHFLESYTGGYNSMLHNIGKPVWSNRNYDKFADEGYVKNVIAHRSVSLIAHSAKNIEFML